MPPAYLVTHSGGFHADDLFSTVILTRLFPAAQVIRSRAPEWITPGPDRIIYDVGGAFDVGARIFDHHQRCAPRRDDGRPYSSFGLIWRQFGHDFLAAKGIPKPAIAQIHADFDADFVLPVDLIDNGALSPADAGPLLSGMVMPAMLESLKPVFDDNGPAADDRAFTTALTVARAFLDARIAQAAAEIRAEAVVRRAIAQAGDSPVLELPMGMPFHAAVVKAGADHLLFVINPRGKDWTIGGIRRDETGFALRADLPAAWAGLSGQGLERASGIKGALFCHNGRFIAAAASREAALAMAARAAAPITCDT